MGSDQLVPKGYSLKRWSQRKGEAERSASEPAPVVVPAPAPPAADAAAKVPAEVPGAAAAARAGDAAALPPVESLTIDSDFTAFLQPKVDEALKRQALKQLFRDPRFNVMDGLDVYIDDYSKPDPISPDTVRQLVQGRYIFDPPATRVNEQGAVEDVPPDGVAAERADDATEPLAEAAPENLSETEADASTDAPPAAPPSTAADAGAKGDREGTAAAQGAVPPSVPRLPEPAPR